MENTASNNVSIIACVFATEGMCLMRGCLATAGSSSLTTDGGIQRHINTHKQQYDLIRLLLIFQNKESKLTTGEMFCAATEKPVI
jgi:hypothetical protein